MRAQPEILMQALVYAQQGRDMALSWLASPVAWSQCALLVLAFLLARLAAGRRVIGVMGGMPT